jgi:hypothetical protein
VSPINAIDRLGGVRAHHQEEVTMLRPYLIETQQRVTGIKYWRRGDGWSDVRKLASRYTLEEAQAIVGDHPAHPLFPLKIVMGGKPAR